MNVNIVTHDWLQQKHHDDKWTLNVATFEQKMARKVVMWKQNVQKEHLLVFKCVRIIKKKDRKVAKQGWKTNQLP
jgi:hypothetical protein